jgi:hypothetical protein
MAKQEVIMDVNVEPGYESLADVLVEALEQAQHGKGLERHAENKPFLEQTICETTREEGHGFTRGQVRKKIKEVKRLSTPAAQIRELLSIIVYTAADILVVKEEQLEGRLRAIIDE